MRGTQQSAADKISSVQGGSEMQRFVALRRGIKLVGRIFDDGARMTADATDYFNEVVQTTELGHTILAVDVYDVNNLHQAMNLESSPVPQGADPLISLLNFINWLHDRAAFAGATVVEMLAPKIPKFDCMSNRSINLIAYGQWMSVQWVLDCRDPANNIGGFANALQFDGTGAAKGEIHVLVNVFHG